MASGNHATGGLLERARDGDREALDRLFDRHREQLLRMVRLRLDGRLRRRLDASDVVQETCLEAGRRFAAYLDEPALPFLVWLRFLCAQKIAELNRRHLGAEMRAAGREIALDDGHTRLDSALIADCLARSVTSPSAAAIRQERRERLERALDTMVETDREVLVMRHFEQLSNVEVAAELKLEPAAASKRYLRALERLRDILGTLGTAD